MIVHNSGIGEANYDLEWEKDLPTINTNVVGATRVYQLAYNYFKKQGFGHLVSITSVASIRGNRHVTAYHASKAFQSSYMESLWMKAKRTKKAKINITIPILLLEILFGWLRLTRQPGKYIEQLKTKKGKYI